MAQEILQDIRAELKRLGAEDARTAIEADFDPQAGPLVKLELAGVYWHLLPSELLLLLKELPDKSGSEVIKTAIQEKASSVWPGPVPRTRDYAP